jgi:hypothetical protein
VASRVLGSPAVGSRVVEVEYRLGKNDVKRQLSVALRNSSRRLTTLPKSRGLNRINGQLNRFGAWITPDLKPLRRDFHPQSSANR